MAVLTSFTDLGGMVNDTYTDPQGIQWILRRVFSDGIYVWGVDTSVSGGSPSGPDVIAAIASEANANLVTDALLTQLQAIGTTDNNLLTDAEQTKIASVESGATTDQTGAEIVTAIDTQLGNTDWQTSGSSGFPVSGIIGGSPDFATHNAGDFVTGSGAMANWQVPEDGNYDIQIYGQFFPNTTTTDCTFLTNIQRISDTTNVTSTTAERFRQPVEAGRNYNFSLAIPAQNLQAGVAYRLQFQASNTGFTQLNVGVNSHLRFVRTS